MVDFLARLATFWIFPRRLREHLRKKIIWSIYGFPVRRRAMRVGSHLHCRGFVHVTRKTELGDHVNFNGAFIYGGGEVKIGDWFHSGEGLKIFTRNHNYAGEALPYDETNVGKPVSIGNCVWIGAYVILLPGTTIGEGAIIQAGSVVHGEIPPLAIAGGNPAKVFAWRDKEHFMRLKAAGRFH